jgi:putative oxidoreductase
MKIANLVARVLLGLMFTVSGLNGFLHFIPVAPKPNLAGQFIGLLVSTHYMVPVFLLQLACGLLFLTNRYLPLALTLIGPVIVNILMIHVLMDPGGILPGGIASVCWLIVFYGVRAAFVGIFQLQAQVTSTDRYGTQFAMMNESKIE